jgi:hypothetical protein
MRGKQSNLLKEQGMTKVYQSLTVLLDKETVDGLRAMAAQRGLVRQRGPSAGHGQGSIAQLLRALVQEAQEQEQA